MILFKLCVRVGEGRMILLLLTKSGLSDSQLPVFIPQSKSGQPVLLRGLQLKSSVRSGEVEDICAQAGPRVVRGKKDGKLLLQVGDGQGSCP